MSHHLLPWLTLGLALLLVVIVGFVVWWLHQNTKDLQ